MQQRRYRHVFLVWALAPLLSGCLTTLAMQGLNGAAPCPPAAVRTAMGNAAILATAQPGDNVRVLSGLSAPEQRKTLLLNDGNVLDILSFRTGHRRCRNMPTVAEFTPVVLTQTGTILGIGEGALRHYQSLAQQRNSWLH